MLLERNCNTKSWQRLTQNSVSQGNSFEKRGTGPRDEYRYAAAGVNEQIETILLPTGQHWTFNLQRERKN